MPAQLQRCLLGGATYTLCRPPASPPPPQNATTIASRFRDLYGLEIALKQELRELGRAQVGSGGRRTGGV